MGRCRLLVMIAATLLTSALVGAAGALEKPKAQESAATDQPEAVPDGKALSILIRRTLLSLNDANLTGNYTVLRDLAAPGFQVANDSAKLAGIFAHLRESKIDLAPIVYFDPKLVRQPEITQNGMLRLSGFIPTKPQQVNFDMLFESVADRWRLFGIAVNTTPAQSGDVRSGAAAAPAGTAASKK